MGQTGVGAARTVGALLDSAKSVDPTRPLITYYDDATGERTELSGLTLDNWVAKTANLLVDGCGLGHGDRARVLLPPHWQTAAVLLGCWSAGLVVAGDPADVLFAAADRAGEGPVDAGEAFALGLAPMALPLATVPAGFADYVVAVRAHGDRFQPYQPLTPQTRATPELTHGELCARAGDRAGQLGIEPGARVLIDLGQPVDALDWLLAPLAAGASTVLCNRLDPARLPARRQAEQVTRVLA